MVKFLIVLVALLCGSIGEAAERMIAYGYTNCVACHVNPQGRNLLTPYGNSIDEAQSLRAKDMPEEPGLFSLGGKVNHIIKGYLNQSHVRADNSPTTSSVTKYLNYQNSTSITSKTTLNFGVDWREPREHETAVTSYYTAPARDPFFLDYAFIKYVAAENFAMVLGKDQLPTGINNADTAAFIHSRNSLANNERPLQAKGFWWSQRSLISTYLYRENGDEARNMGEEGYGILAETDLYNNRTVVGLNALNGSSLTSDRQAVSLYSRLGFIDRFGFLLEVTETWRHLKNATGDDFAQTTFFGQAFFTPLEWVVWSLTYEFLDVEDPYGQFMTAYGGKLGLRLSRNFSITSSLRYTNKNHVGTETAQMAVLAKY